MMTKVTFRRKSFNLAYDSKVIRVRHGGKAWHQVSDFVAGKGN